MSPIGNLMYLTEDQLVLERCVETAGKEVCHDATATSWRKGRRPERGAYSPEWVEGEFSELRQQEVRSPSHSPGPLPISLRCSWPRRIGPLLRPRVAPMQLDRV
jgi:hypothetical protein